MGTLMVPFFLKKGPLKSPLGVQEGSTQKVHTLESGPNICFVLTQTGPYVLTTFRIYTVLLSGDMWVVYLEL